jgi:prolyl-tRNA editing enzyme YbaK/EbsC (Cys-tRNA(Pro) deacylase)
MHRVQPGVVAGRRDAGERRVSIGGQDGAVLPRLGSLVSLPVADHPELLAPSVAAALAGWEHAPEVAVVEIDPELADTAAMTDHYGTSLLDSANCVVVAGARAGDERIAACVVRADTRADVNKRVRHLLDVRKASFLAMDRATGESGMEHGGITPVGLPADWRVLVDARVLEIDVAIIGSGVRRSKLLLPGRLLGELPAAEVVADLAT